MLLGGAGNKPMRGGDHVDDASADAPLLRQSCSWVLGFLLKGSGGGAALLGICVRQQKIVIDKLENQRRWNAPENAASHGAKPFAFALTSASSEAFAKA